jgi:hypothetical protein
MPPRLPGIAPELSIGHHGQPDGAEQHADDLFGRPHGEVAPAPLPIEHPPHPEPWPLQQLGNEPTSFSAGGVSLPSNDEDSPTRRRRPRSAISAVAFTAIGFVAGVAFWHAVGFWDMVHDAVFSGPRLQASAHPPAAAAPLALPSVEFDEQDLRWHAVRPTPIQPDRITTGSIGKPTSPDRLAPGAQSQPATGMAAPPPDHEVTADPRQNSWLPAVTTVP